MILDGIGSHRRTVINGEKERIGWKEYSSRDRYLRLMHFPSPDVITSDQVIGGAQLARTTNSRDG